MHSVDDGGADDSHRERAASCQELLNPKAPRGYDGSFVQAVSTHFQSGFPFPRRRLLW